MKISEQFYEYAYIFLADQNAVGSIAEESEYQRLIERAGQRVPALWESCYRNGTGRLLDKYTLAVQRAYKKSGVKIVRSDQANEPADYIGYECLFLSFWSFVLEKETGSENFTDVGAMAGKILLRFLEEHMLLFSENLKKELELHGNYPKFTKLVKELQRTAEKLKDIVTQYDRCGQEKREAQDKKLDDQIPVWISEWESEHQSRPIPASFAFCSPNQKEERVWIRSAGCWNNCGSSCLKEVEVCDGCVLRVRSARTEELQENRLTTCIRGLASAETYLTADRLRYPLLRTGKRGSGSFRRISWEEALQRIAAENVRIRDTYGAASRYITYSTGVVSLVRPDEVLRRFLNLDGGFLGFYNDYSAACTQWATSLMYGTGKTGNSAEDLLNSSLILVWGHNPLETGFGPALRKMLCRAKKKGIRIITIDPRCSDTAAYGDEWIPIRPATDGALAAGMAYVIISENLHDKKFLHTYCSGYDHETMPKQYQKEESYEEYILGIRDQIPKTPEWAEKITGIPKEKIIELAHLYAESKPAAILQGCGPQRHANGEQTVRMITALSSLCGNVGISGGRCGAEDDTEKPVKAYFPNGEERYPGKIPCYLWTKAVREGTCMKPVKDGLLGVTKLDSNVKMLWCLGGNTLINQHGDINETRKILENESLCECIVCSDVFMTPSAMYADIILPAASCYEIDNITPAWQEGDFLLYNRKMTEPLFESRFEYEWIRRLAWMSGEGEDFDDGKETMEEWLKSLYRDMQITDSALISYEKLRENGIARYSERPPVIAFEQQRKDPDHHPFPTYSGKIDFFIPYIYHLYGEEEIAAIPKYVPCGEGIEELSEDENEFQLIGWHTKVRTHSCHDNNRILQKKEPEAVWMHPEDAKKLGITEGETIILENVRGRMKVPVKITSRIATRVLALSQGAWYDPDSEGTDQRGSINILTSLKPTPLAKGNPQHTNIVRVRKREKDISAGLDI